MYKNGRPARVVMTDAGLNDYINDILFVSYGYRTANHPSGSVLTYVDTHINPIDANSAVRPHVGTDPVSVRLPSDKDGIKTKPQSRPEILLFGRSTELAWESDRHGVCPYMRASRPSGSVYPTLARQGGDNLS